jgi:hypothetical protein
MTITASSRASSHFTRARKGTELVFLFGIDILPVQSASVGWQDSIGFTVSHGKCFGPPIDCDRRMHIGCDEEGVPALTVREGNNLPRSRTIWLYEVCIYWTASEDVLTSDGQSFLVKFEKISRLQQRR